MGSAGSKAARSAPRKYPSRPAGVSPAMQPAPPQRPARPPPPSSSASSPSASSPAKSAPPPPPPPQQPEQPPRPPRPREDLRDPVDPRYPREPPKGAPQASFTKNDAIRADGGDPDDVPEAAFADRLRQMGIVQPNPTFSASSTVAAAARRAQFNPYQSTQPAFFPSQHPNSLRGPQSNATLSVLEARRRLQDLAAEESTGGWAVTMSTSSSDSSSAGASRKTGREFLTAATLRDILQMREKGVAAAEIEKKLHLKDGVVARLGPRGFVEAL